MLVCQYFTVSLGARSVMSVCGWMLFCPIGNYLRESPYQNNTMIGEERMLWLYLCFLTNIFFLVYMPFG